MAVNTSQLLVMVVLVVVKVVLPQTQKALGVLILVLTFMVEKLHKMVVLVHLLEMQTTTVAQELVVAVVIVKFMRITLTKLLRDKQVAMDSMQEQATSTREEQAKEQEALEKAKRQAQRSKRVAGFIIDPQKLEEQKRQREREGARTRSC